MSTSNGDPLVVYIPFPMLHSVVDRDLRSHDHPNLFLLGSAVFPTSATANPTLTIAALSLRAVDAVRASLA